MKNEKFIIIFFLFSLLWGNVKENIIKFYKSYYPTIKIENIKISPSPPKKYKIIKIFLSPKRNYGNIKIDNRFYYIKIKAFIKVYKSTQIIKTNQTLLNKVKLTTIPFRNFYSKPIFKLTQNLVASKIISKNSIINQSNTKKKPLIFKGSNISAIIKSKNIIIYSKAKALEDGYKGDKIKVLINKRVRNAIILERGKVEIK